ncbi:hypothetical protein KAI04_03605 [Candidatus Pacearchaeota archaeon]|nr:hypothetical protein [Candidatus Pacearchaeota archaeon]
MYKKYLIIASKKDKAGVNITTQLSQFPKENFSFYLVEEHTVYTENLDLEKINQFDFIIFASKHKSEKKEKTLSIHAPGNWRSAQLGGESEKVSKTSALFQKQLFEILNQNVISSGLKDKYKVTLECTHHGPLIDKPCVFIEIGSTHEEWEDRRAGFILAKTISETIKNFKSNPYNEVAIAIGGPHYCPNFNKLQLNSNVAISHVIPNYAFPLTKEMVEEAIEKTEEEVDFAVIDWKGMGKAEQRDKALEILDKLYISYKRTSEIGK